MTTIIACLIAGVSIAAFVTLWFWVVRRELYAAQKVVEAADCQLTASKQAHLRVRDDPKEEQAHEILVRSERVYKQSVQRYNETLHKPWNAVPGALMGFHVLGTERDQSSV